MAVFIDSCGEGYIGIIYSRDGDCYSGNFVSASSKTINFLRLVFPILIKVTGYSILVVFMIGMIKTLLGEIELLNDILVAFFLFGTSLAVVTSIGMVFLSRSKKNFQKHRLTCLNNLSQQIYLFMLYDVLLTIFAGIFGVGLIFEIIYVSPIVIGCFFAIWRYRQR